MTPNEMYALEPESVTKDIGILVGYGYNHIPEISFDFGCEIELESNQRVEVRYLKDFCFDGRRVWILASVWFDGKPVMIIQNAGREGSDHERRFLTDTSTYKEMVGYIQSLLSSVTEDDLVITDPDSEVPDLDKFYGHSLSSEFRYSY